MNPLPPQFKNGADQQIFSSSQYVVCCSDWSEPIKLITMTVDEAKGRIFPPLNMNYMSLGVLLYVFPLNTSKEDVEETVNNQLVLNQTAFKGKSAEELRKYYSRLLQFPFPLHRRQFEIAYLAQTFVHYCPLMNKNSLESQLHQLLTNDKFQPWNIDESSQLIKKEEEKQQQCTILTKENTYFYPSKISNEGHFGSISKLIIHNKAFALKRIPKLKKNNNNEDEYSQSQFEKETNIMSQLRKDCNDHFICIYECYSDDKFYYILMEWLNSTYRTMNDLIKVHSSINETDDLPLISNVRRNLFTALDLLHNKYSIVHNDVKPDNIFVRENGQVKLFDFGLSFSKNDWMKSDLASLLQLYVPIYTSPKKLAFIHNNNEKQDKLSIFNNILMPSDNWAANICIFQLLKGRFPYLIEQVAHSTKTLVQTLIKNENEITKEIQSSIAILLK